MVDGRMKLSMAPEMHTAGGGNLRRYSMGKASSFDVDERNIPHHRRISIGSCHDFCKYGNKHSFETKVRDPFLKRALKKSLDGQNSDQVVALPEREKTIVLVTKLKASPISETCITDSSDVVKFEVPVNSPCKQSSVDIEVVNESKKSVAKTKIPKTTQVVFSAKKAEFSPKQALTNSEKRRFPEKLDGSLKPKTLKVRSVISGRFSEKLDSLLKPKTFKVKPMISPSSSRNAAVQRNYNSNAGKGLRTSKGIAMKVILNPTTSRDPKPVDAVANLRAIKNTNTKVVSPLKSQNKMRRAQTKDEPNVDVPEKTLYIVNMEVKSKLVESDQSTKNALGLCPKLPSSIADSPSFSPHKEDQVRDESKYMRNVDASFSESNEFDSIKKGKASNGNNKGQSPRMLHSKGKDASSLSLNFRKAKVVDIHSEIHSPRRLKFRREKLLANNQQSNDNQRTSFKKVVVSEISRDSVPPSEKVVLRHQDVQGKKDTRVLLNNVIEETANKLVRTRKSKVKALVGAFESVISLQDNKRSSKTIA